MLKTFVFPSVCRPFEGTMDSTSTTDNSAFAPLVLKFRGKEYLVGKSPDIPDRMTAVSPAGIDFQLLVRVALLLADTEGAGGVSLAVSLPLSLSVYGDVMKKSLQGKISVEFGASQVCKEYIRREIDISHLQVISRLESCEAAIRLGPFREKGVFMLVNLGQRACEAAISIPGEPFAQQFCARGIRSGIDLGVGMESLQQALFGCKTANTNVPRLREEVLLHYYEAVVSPGIRKMLSGCNDRGGLKIYLCGDGASYPELQQCFRDEFGGGFPVVVYPAPEKCASQGCCIRGQHVRQGFPGPVVAVGLDVDDRYTCVSVLRDK